MLGSILRVAAISITLSAVGCAEQGELAAAEMQGTSAVVIDAGAEDASVIADGGACDLLEVCCASLPEQSRNWCQYNIGFLRVTGDAACERVREAYCEAD